MTLFPAVFAPAVQAQEAEDAWKDLVTQGQHAAGNGEYPKAEQSFLKAVHEAERFAADDWRVGVTLESLGQVYTAEKKFSDGGKRLSAGSRNRGKSQWRRQRRSR